MRRLLASTAALAVGLTLLAAPAAAQTAKPDGAKKPPAEKPKPKPIQADTAFVGGFLIDGSGGAPMRNAVVLVRAGKVIATAPVGKIVFEAKTTVDCKGKTVCPGMIDGRSLLFVDARDLGSRAGVGNRVADALNLYDERARSALARGVTSVHVGPYGYRPPVGQLLGGEGAIVKLTGDGERTGTVAIARATVTGTYVRHAGDATTRGLHIQSFDKYRGQLEAAETYKESWDKYAKKLAKYKKDHQSWKIKVFAWKAKKKAFDAAQKKAGAKKPPAKKAGAKKPPAKKAGAKKPPAKKAGAKKPPVKKPAAKMPPMPKEPTKPREPRRDTKLDVLSQVLAKKQRLVLRAEKADDIASAIELAKLFSLSITLDAPTEAYAKIDEIVKGKHAVLLAPVSGPEVSDVGAMSARPDTASQLLGNGVPVGIGSAGTNALESRFLRFYAIQTIGHGTQALQAIGSVTLGAAKALGVDKRLGSLQKGKDADIVLIDGPFTALGSKVSAVYIDGKLAYSKKKEAAK